MRLLTIADGTDTAITVRDVRQDAPWATKGAPRVPRPPRAIILHHTANRGQPETYAAQTAAMLQVAQSAMYGLPYNFVVFPLPKASVYYVNDVDRHWPHTLGWNDCTAIALWGDWTLATVPANALSRIDRLIGALRSMWQMDVPTRGHRDCVPTICPGADLQERYGKTRGIKLRFGQDGAPPEMHGCHGGLGVHLPRLSMMD